MKPVTTHQNHLSSTERARQLEESTARAMERYRSEFEALRARTARLRAEREAREAAAPAPPQKGRKPARKT